MRLPTLLLSLALAACGQGSAPPRDVARIRVDAAPALVSPTATLDAAAPRVRRTLDDMKLTAVEAGPDCIPGGTFTGTAHASLYFQSRSGASEGQLSKAWQSFDCRGTPAALLLFDLGQDGRTLEEAWVIGMGIWGAKHPTAEHPDLIFHGQGFVAVVSSTKPAALAQAVVAARALEPYDSEGAHDADLRAEELAELRGRLDCARPWVARYCAALDGFERGRPLPSLEVSLLGSSAVVDDGASEEASYLVLGPAGGRHGTIAPESLDEEREIARTLERLRRGEKIVDSAPIAQYVLSLAGKGLTPLKTVGSSSFLAGSSRVYLRQVGASIVVVEIAGDGTRAIGLF